MGTVFKSQEVQEDYLTLEDGADRLSRNVDDYNSTLRDILEG